MVTAERFIEINETFGWDASVDYIVSNTDDIAIKSMADDYYRGYKFCENDDVDSGRCFEIRSKAIGDIAEYLYRKTKTTKIIV